MAMVNVSGCVATDHMIFGYDLPALERSSVHDHIQKASKETCSSNQHALFEIKKKKGNLSKSEEICANLLFCS